MKIVAWSVKFMKSLHLADMAQSLKRRERELSLKDKVEKMEKNLQNQNNINVQ